MKLLEQVSIYVMFSCQMKEVGKFLGNVLMNFIITDALYCILSPEVVLHVFKVQRKGSTLRKFVFKRRGSGMEIYC